MRLLGAALTAFLSMRVLDTAFPGFLTRFGSLRTPSGRFLLWLVVGLASAGAYTYAAGSGGYFLVVPAYGAALLLYRLDGFLLAKADESIHLITKNRR